VTLAASVFCISGLSRSCILMHVALAATGAYDPNATDEDNTEEEEQPPAVPHPPNATASFATRGRHAGHSSYDPDRISFTLAPVTVRHRPPSPPPARLHPPPHHSDRLLSPPVFLSMGVAMPDLLPTVVALLVLRRRSRLGLCFGGRTRTEGSGMTWSPVDRAPLRGGYGSEFEVPGWRAGGL
jgi:hypothetical protein